MKMKRKARILSVVLCLAMITGAFSGCSSQPKKDVENGGEPSGDPTQSAAPIEVDMTMFEWGWEGPEEGKDEVVPLIEEKTGVKINLHRWIISSEEDYKRQLSLWASSDDFPEVLDLPPDTYTVELVNQLGDAGKLYQVDDIVQRMDPAAHQMIRDSMDFYKSRKSDKSYLYPTQNNDYDAMIALDNICQQGIMLRKDWMDKLGLEYPKTPEDLYTVLKSFKEEIKEVNGQAVIPLTFSENLAGADRFQEMFFDESDRFGRFRALPDGSYTNEFDQTKLGNYLRWMNKLYRDGLLDHEVATIKASQYQERMNAGRVGATGEAWWNMNSYNDNLKAIDPNTFYVFAPIPKGEGVTKPVQQFITCGAPCGFVFSKKMSQEKFDKVIDMFAFMSTTEGLTISWFGKEGVHWDKDADGKMKFTEQFMTETGGDWNKQAQRGPGYYVGMSPKVSLLDPLMTPPEYLGRPDVVESRKNLQGTIFKATDPQDLVPPGPVETKKMGAIWAQYRELVVKATLATSEAECQKLIDGWPAVWENLGGKEIVAEKNEMMK